MRSLLSTLCAAGLLAVWLSACGKPSGAGSGPTGTEPPPLPPEVQGLAVNPPPAAGASGARVEETGSTVVATGEFVSPVRSELSSRIPGRVERVFVDEGESVRKGQRLLQLETTYLDLAVESAEAEAARAEAAFEEARRDFDRKKGLIAKDSIPQALYDRSKSTLDQAEASKAGADSALALARQRRADATLDSPVDGYVMERRIDVGESLDDKTVTFVVVQTAPLKLRFRLPERYLALVREGQTVRASVDPYSGEVFDGQVAIVGQTVDSGTRTFPVEAEFPNRDRRLKPGLFARVELDLAS